MLKPAVRTHALIECILARMSERSMAEGVSQADGLRERFIESQRKRCGTGNLRNFNRMRDSRAVQVALVIDEHLCFVDEPAEGVGVNDPIAIALEFAAKFRFGLRMPTPTRLFVM